MVRRARDQWLLLLLSIVGAGIAIYLTTVHYANVPLVCSNSGFVDCARVISSPYSFVPGTTIPITVPGLLWCAVSAGLAIAGIRLLPEQHRLRIAEFVWMLVGMVTVLYLVYVEIVLLHTICAWCTVLHVIILIMFLITVIRLQQPASDLDEFEDEDEVASPTTTSLS